MYLSSVLHATIRFFTCGFLPPKCTTFYFVIRPFLNKYVLLPFVSITTHFKLISLMNWFHLVVIVFTLWETLSTSEGINSSLALSLPASLCYSVVSNIPSLARDKFWASFGDNHDHRFASKYMCVCVHSFFFLNIVKFGGP